MTYKIMGDCIKCGGCLDECPQEAIIEGEDNKITRIDLEKCDDC